MRLPASALFLLLPLLLGGCSDSARNRPGTECAAPARLPPRDSAAWYFPATDSLPPGYVPPAQRRPDQDYTPAQTDNCAHTLFFASRCLFFFRAPVLATCYPGADTYRLLWTRSFHRPVLLTLRRDGQGGFLRTQLLSKPFLPAIQRVLFEPPGLDSVHLARLRADFARDTATPAARAERRRERQPPVVVVDTTITISVAQWRHFEQLLDQARFWQLPACQPEYVLDGARWRLEARRPGRYHQIDRHSPEETDAYRRSCEYLIALSPALRHEERY